jgi:aspartate/methionine/tyrosine aminotransferase
MFTESLRPEARLAPPSGIVAVINRARGREGLIPLWAGEGDLPTPDFISEAAAAGLRAGETFYTWQHGIPELREALSRYYARHFGQVLGPERFTVTGSGMHAIQMVIHALAGHGDEVAYLSPAWPNFAAAAGIAGAKAVPVVLDHSDNGWSLDLARLEASISPRTRAIFVNTPCNPSGWTADRETLAAILAIARRRGVWVIADEIYSLFHYGPGRAASFLDVAEPDDRIIYVNSFSKNWAMTGWRVGWIVAPPELLQVLENLVQYSNSGVPAFLQRGCVAALDHGDGFVAEQVARAGRARDLLCERLLRTGRVSTTAPEGAFYLFFKVDGITDTRQAAFDIVDEANVALAPGTAFGPGGEPFLRLCFHRRIDQIEEAADRLAHWLEKRPAASAA